LSILVIFGSSQAAEAGTGAGAGGAGAAAGAVGDGAAAAVLLLVLLLLLLLTRLATSTTVQCSTCNMYWDLGSVVHAGVATNWWCCTFHCGFVGCT